MVNWFCEFGGLYMFDDFVVVKGEYVMLVMIDFCGYMIYECLFNGQGIIVLMIFNILLYFEVKGVLDDVDCIYIEFEVMCFVYVVCDSWLVDFVKVNVLVEEMLLDEMVKWFVGMIDLKWVIVDLLLFELFFYCDMVYIMVVDFECNVVSFINFVFYMFGFCIVVLKFGVVMYNCGQSFLLICGYFNMIVFEKCLLYIIIFGMVIKDGCMVMFFGVMGGYYQVMGYVYFIFKVFDYGMDMQDVIDLLCLVLVSGFSFKIEVEQMVLVVIIVELKV